MKVVINKTGEVREVAQNLGQRLINKGKAHIIKDIPVIVPLNVVQKKELPEDLKVVNIDLIEPIPERFTSFEEPKSKRKSRKKKSKFESWND